MKGQLGFIFEMKMELELAQVDLQGRLGIFDHFSIIQTHLKYLIISSRCEKLWIMKKSDGSNHKVYIKVVIITRKFLSLLMSRNQ